jgi:hypothetical protein
MGSLESSQSEPKPEAAYPSDLVGLHLFVQRKQQRISMPAHQRAPSRCQVDI